MVRVPESSASSSKLEDSFHSSYETLKPHNIFATINNMPSQSRNILDKPMYDPRYLDHFAGLSYIDKQGIVVILRERREKAIVPLVALQKTPSHRVLNLPK